MILDESILLDDTLFVSLGILKIEKVNETSSKKAARNFSFLILICKFLSIDTAKISFELPDIIAGN